MIHSLRSQLLAWTNEEVIDLVWFTNDQVGAECCACRDWKVEGYVEAVAMQIQYHFIESCPDS